VLAHTRLSLAATINLDPVRNRFRNAMPTVQDVARRAGVSAASVSYVLNGTRYVSEELRERVLRAVRELDYEPNAAARTLRSNRSYTIGLILSDLRNPFFTETVRGIEAVPGRPATT